MLFSLFIAFLLPNIFPKKRPKMQHIFPNSINYPLLRRTTITVLGAFLDSFQKIADAATNTKGKNQRFNLIRKTPLFSTYIVHCSGG